jgi:LysM repeat protein
MRRRLIFAVSAGLNLALACLLYMSKHRSTPSTGVAGGGSDSGTNKVRTQFVLRKQFFTWQQVETPDYPTYIANLRTIGCPELTIRDIVVADVNQLYAKKRLMEVVTPDQQWWRSTPDSNVLRAASAKLLALNQERRELLTTLLGPNWELADPAARRSVVPLTGPILGELPPETRQAVEDIAANSQQRVQAYLEEQKKAGQDVDRSELVKLDRETRSELSQVLNPAQFEEYLLRYSQTASDLRSQLTGLDVTPDEFRSLFRATDSIDQQLQDAAAIQKPALEKELENAIKNVLGPDRYQAYLTSQDPAYRDAVAVAQQYGASADVVQSLYELNQATQEEIDRIRNDPGLTPEQKAAQLKEVQQDQADARNDLLGLTPPAPTPSTPTPAPSQIHTFSPGETVNQIAAQYGVTPNSILNANPNLDFNKLPRGAPIRIPQSQ